MHQTNIIWQGKDSAGADKALILLHGRGSNAEAILSLSQYLQVKDFALAAPQAANGTWYPYSFLAPPAQNEPRLSLALQQVGQTVAILTLQGIAASSIYFAGFSQGACLMLEYAARHAQRYGGLIAFTGGLIGDRIYRDRYSGNFAGTPVFIGSADPDFHVPVERVYATANVLREMGAAVTEKIYTNMGHTINADEMIQANAVLGKQGVLN